MILLSLVFSDINIDTLDVPDKIEPSSYIVSQDTLTEYKVSERLSTMLMNNPSLLQADDSIIDSLSILPQDKEELVTLREKSKDDIFQKSGKRGWFVNPLDAPSWVIWVSILPAILLSILLYLDQNITGRLVNHSQ